MDGPSVRGKPLTCTRVGVISMPFNCMPSGRSDLLHENIKRVESMSSTSFVSQARLEDDRAQTEFVNLTDIVKQI